MTLPKAAPAIDESGLSMFGNSRPLLGVNFDDTALVVEQVRTPQGDRYRCLRGRRVGSSRKMAIDALADSVIDWPAFPLDWARGELNALRAGWEDDEPGVFARTYRVSPAGGHIQAGTIHLSMHDPQHPTISSWLENWDRGYRQTTIRPWCDVLDLREPDLQFSIEQSAIGRLLGEQARRSDHVLDALPALLRRYLRRQTILNRPS